MSRNTYATAAVPTTFPDLSPGGARAHNSLLRALGPDHIVAKRVASISNEVADTIIAGDGASAAYASSLERRKIARENHGLALAAEQPDQARVSATREASTRAAAAVESFERGETARLKTVEDLRIISNGIPPVLGEYWKPGQGQKSGVNIVLGLVGLGGDAGPIPLADEPSITMPRDGWAGLVAEKRAEVTSLRAERARKVHPPLEEALRAATRHINTLAASAQPAWGGKKIDWPMTTIGAEPSRFGSQDAVRVIDAEALFTRYNREQVLADIEANLRDRYAGELADEVVLDADGARKRLRDLDARIAQAETIECEAFWRGRESGETIAWRADVNIKRLLGIAA